jgi:predicted nucleotidyltransferase
MRQELPPEFESLQGIADPFERRLYFAAILAKYAAKRGGTFVIVGGHAVEFYTRGHYATADADLLTPDKAPLAQLLIEWGFELEGRVYWHADLELVVDLIDARIPGDPERVVDVGIRGLTVRILPVEEVIIDRLNAGVHWDSPNDIRWTAAVCRANRARLDWDYLRRRAQEEQTSDALETLRREVDSDAHTY